MSDDSGSHEDVATDSRGRAISGEVVNELQTAALRIRVAVVAYRVWQRLFTEEDRQRLGGDIEECFPRLGTAGMWQQARGVSFERAVVEVASGINLMSGETANWLLRELGEVDVIPTPDRPVWDDRTGELRFEGNVVRRVRIMKRPSNIQQILAAFQAAGWPIRIDNPLTLGQQQLHETLRSLNHGLGRIRFRAQEGAEAVCWELI